MILASLSERSERVRYERGTEKHAHAKNAKKGNNTLRENTNCTNETNRSNGRGGKRLVDSTVSSERAVLVVFDIFALFVIREVLGGLSGSCCKLTADC